MSGSESESVVCTADRVISDAWVPNGEDRCLEPLSGCAPHCDRINREGQNPAI
jgi:hypothetical protein